MAQGIKVDTIPQNVKNITFTVDGFSYGDTQNRGRQLETALKTADPEGFGKKHKIISITGEDYTNLPGAPGVPQPVRGAVESFQALNRQLFDTQIKGRNPQAIELAAQMHAYSQAYNYTSGGKEKPAEQVKTISVIGHHEGGNVVDEAMEIFSVMNPKAAKNVRVVKLGTPHFGLTDEIAKTYTPKGKDQSNKSTGRTITITSPKDAFSFFPKMNPQQFNTVKGNKITDYISDRRAFDTIKGVVETNNFGKPKDRKVAEPPMLQYDPTDPNPLTKPGFGTDISKRQEEAEELRDWHRRQLRYAKKREEMGRYWKAVEKAGKGQPKSTPREGQVLRTPNPSDIPSGNPENAENISLNPKPKPIKKKKSDSLYGDFQLDSFNSVLGGVNQDDDSGTAFDPKIALRYAIAPTCPAIAQVLTIESESGGLTGKFIDNRRRLYRYRIKGANISYQEVLPPGRTDSIGGPDDCKLGTPCKNSCIERGTKCLGTLSESSQAIVKLVQQTLEKEEVPSRKEIMKVAGLAVKDFVRNPVQFIREGKEREKFVMKGLEAVSGQKLPDKAVMTAQLLQKAGTKMDGYVDKVQEALVNPDTVKEGVVATAGYVGSQVGAAVGGFPGQLAGDLAGAVATRKAIDDYQRLQKARGTLKDDEAFAKANKLKKVQMLNQQMLSDMRSDAEKQKASDDLTADIAGWAIGNAVANTVATKVMPFPGAAAALAFAPVIVSAKNKIKSGESVGSAIASASDERVNQLLTPANEVKSGNQREAEARKKASENIRKFKQALFTGR
jgi:uncharacterized protein YejL (UPF0352 family)